MISFGMIDLKISIFITGLDCCNNYSQKAFPNSCSCKYFKGILFFTIWWGQAQICDQYLLKKNFIEDSSHICSENFQNNSNIEMMDRSSHQNVYYFS